MGGGRRKGEMSKSAIDSGWPHQVTLHESQVQGRNYVTVHYFIDAEGLSHCPRGHTFLRDNAYYHVFCFAEKEHADRFHARFGGEIIDPKDRPRWPNKPPRRKA
jgi:hypothetical protein